MCAEERGAKATITHSDFVAIFPCQWLAGGVPIGHVLSERSAGWASDTDAISVERFAHL